MRGFGQPRRDSRVAHVIAHILAPLVPPTRQAPRPEFDHFGVGKVRSIAPRAAMMPSVHETPEYCLIDEGQVP